MTEPISTADAAAHLNAASDDPNYSKIVGYLTAARVAVEQYLNATILNRTLTVRLDSFPSSDGVILLPNGPVVEVESISYVNAAGTTSTVGEWSAVDDAIYPAYGESWPTARDQAGAVTITYTAGMMTGSPLALGDDYADVRAGILLQLGDLWANREANILGTTVAINPTLERLLHFRRRNLGT